MLYRRQDTPEEVKMQQAEQCWELRVSGMSYRKIAEELGIARQTVMNRLDYYMSNRVIPSAEQYREVVISRLEKLHAACEPGVRDGDPKAIANATKIALSLNKAAGLEVIKLEHSGTISTPLDNEISTMLSQMEQLDEKAPASQPTEVQA